MPDQIARRDDGQAHGAAAAVASQAVMDTRRIEETYSRIIDLVGSISRHLELQDRRAERMTPTVERLAEGLVQIPETTATQVKLLAEIGRRMETDAESSRRIEGLLAQLPHIADAQRETMVAMGRRLDAISQADERRAAAAAEFGHALSQLAESSRASCSSLEHIRVDLARQADELGRLVERQTRRLIYFAWAAMAVATVAAAGTIVAVLR